ncbi:hypothetical protein HOLleu_22832 [Holothuria leucospilota]|uniref:Uncharacterized protein n=1 Tax=Holothuria leucospilota TaxID=206669 RepID=A0A9Q1BU26_HOLLE|nr:hypothetical protein HOLleu_22832 [Holothuria leucospilota]
MDIDALHMLHPICGTSYLTISGSALISLHLSVTSRLISLLVPLNVTKMSDFLSSA